MRLASLKELLPGILAIIGVPGCMLDIDDLWNWDDDCDSCIDDPCGGIIYEAIGWETVTTLGLTPAEAFETAAGSCASTLQWDASDMGDGVVTPASGSSPIGVSLVFDTDSATIGYHENGGAGIDEMCDEVYLRASAAVSIATEDGVFQDAGTVEARYTTGFGVGEMQLDVPYEAMGGTLSVALQPGETGSLIYEFDGPGDVCAGTLLMSVNGTEGDGIGYAMIGVVGHWSENGCPLGTDPFDLSAPLNEEEGQSAYELFESTWNEQAFDAAWDESSSGSNTELYIDAVIAANQGCREGYGVYFPSTITYGTTDGAIGIHAVEGQGSITLSAEEAVRGLAVDFSDDIFCEDENDTLAYGFGDCHLLEGITVQLRMEWFEGEWRFSDDGVMVYEYHRQSSAPPGAADIVRILTPM
jgi:hypothetical protein